MPDLGATPCILCQHSKDDIDGKKLLNNCDLLDGDACTCCKDYVELEDKITAAKQLLNDLVGQRPESRTRINQKHDNLTTRLPLEIVCHIFMLYATGGTNFSSFDFQVNPLPLGGVCRTWRDIAWTTRPLWTAFVLDLDRPTNPNSVVLTREWLERAGQLPLSILISGCFPQVEESDSERQNELIALINERSTQWGILNIYSETELISLLKGGQGGAPNLRELRIKAHDVRSKPRFALMDGMARPSYLSLDHFAPCSVRIDWTYLTHVSIHRPCIHEGIEILERAPNLVYCRIDSTETPTSESLTPSAPIQYRPNLQSLALEWELSHTNYFQAAETIFLFKSFMFPNLKHLDIRHVEWQGDMHNTSVPPSLSDIINSSSHLLSLRIEYSWTYTITRFIIPLLHKTPLLRRFEIHSWWPGGWEGEQHPFLELLSKSSVPQDDQQVGFLPNLESLEFHIRDDRNAHKMWKSIPGIFGTVSSPLLRPLKTLRVRVRVTNPVHIQSADLVLELLRLRQGGITLDLKDENEGVDILEESMTFHHLAPERLDPPATK